jgi:Bacterial Ig domain
MKSTLIKGVQLALASSVLATGIAGAALQDHGPGDAAVRFPVWYRDNNNLAIGLCKSTQLGPNGPLCFPLQSETVPPSFVGNLGPEMFYMNLNANVVSGAINLRYVAALEAAYGTANPVGAARLGNEVLFSRIRFTMAVNDPNCGGDYQIVHPYGSEPFTDVPTGKRALFSTLDTPVGAIGDFESAMTRGSLGPFLQSDANGDGNADPNIVAANGDQFIGDPGASVPFVGSPFGTNYVEVQYNGPNTVGTGAGQCNLDGIGGGVVRVSTGNLMGQVWTAPIPTPTTVTDAVFSKTAAGNVTVDVSATTAAGNTLIVSAGGMPSAQMTEDKTPAGVGTKQYHAHLEYNGIAPATVTVTNTSSVPAISVEKELRDTIQITKNEYDPVTHTLCVHAHSLDQTAAPDDARLLLAGPHGGAFNSTPCFGGSSDPRDSYFSVVLPNAAPQVTSSSIGIQVQSNHGGIHKDDVEFLDGAPDNLPGAPVANDDSQNVPTGVSTNINVGANDSTPGTATIIVSQPVSGTVTSPGPGVITYTPAANTPAGNQNFTYLIQNGARVSNVARVDANVQFVALPPITSPDNFAVKAAPGSFTINVVANDKAATGTTINPGSVVITTDGTRGHAVSNGDGTVTYTPGVVAGTDTFFYTVSSEGGASAPTRVDVGVTAGAENISFIKNRYTSASGAWVITLQENVAGWSGGALTPTASCYLMARNGTNLAIPEFIGSALVSAVNSQAAITAVAGAAVTLPNGTQGIVPVGNATKGSSYTIQCASTNHVSAYPSTAAGGTDRPSQVTGAQ